MTCCFPGGQTIANFFRKPAAFTAEAQQPAQQTETSDSARLAAAIKDARVAPISRLDSYLSAKSSMDSSYRTAEQDLGEVGDLVQQPSSRAVSSGTISRSSSLPFESGSSDSESIKEEDIQEEEGVLDLSVSVFDQNPRTRLRRSEIASSGTISRSSLLPFERSSDSESIKEEDIQEEEGVLDLSVSVFDRNPRTRLRRSEIEFERRMTEALSRQNQNAVAAQLPAGAELPEEEHLQEGEQAATLGNNDEVVAAVNDQDEIFGLTEIPGSQSDQVDENGWVNVEDEIFDIEI